MRTPVLTTVLLAAPVLVAAVVVAPPAQARDALHQSFSDSGELCDSGVVVEYVEELDLHWISRRVRGSDQTWSFTVWSEGTTSWTNPVDGRTVTMTYSKVDRDVTVADNGDGTRTIHTLNNRNEKYVGPDGTVLRNRGPIWLDVVVTDSGTPADPFDDEWVDLLGVRQGGNWDMGETWCDQMVAWLA